MHIYFEMSYRYSRITKKRHKYHGLEKGTSGMTVVKQQLSIDGQKQFKVFTTITYSAPLYLIV